jgi:hypothetical protein
MKVLHHLAMQDSAEQLDAILLSGGVIGLSTSNSGKGALLNDPQLPAHLGEDRQALVEVGAAVGG